MRIRLEDARVTNIHDLPLGTLVRPTSHGFTGIFDAGMVVEFNGTLRGVLLLDGEFRFTVFVIEDAQAFIPIPRTSLTVQNIDALEQGAHDSAFGSLTLRSGGGPVLRCRIHNGASGVYVDLTTGLGVKLGTDELRESFLAWQLVAVDQNTKQEQIVGTGPTWK